MVEHRPDQTVVEQHFQRETLAGVETLKREIGYTPTRFLQMVGEHGAAGTARRLLRGRQYSEGFTTLWEKRRLDMSVEVLVLLPWYADLFSELEREEASRRLEEHGFDVAAFLTRFAATHPNGGMANSRDRHGR